MVELVMVIVILGMLISMIVFTPQSFGEASNAKEQAGDTANIMRRLETAYTSQDIGSPSYPSTVEMLADVSSRTRTMSRTDADIFKAPGESSSSVTAANTTDSTYPAGYRTPTTSQYVYQPLRADGALCTASPSSASAATRCVRYFLYYLDIETATNHKLRSLHQQ